jgi:Salmonella virulence plasmid 65kDa B protein
MRRPTRTGAFGPFVLFLALAHWSLHDCVRADVTETGAYQKTIPLTVPRFHAITPSIALVYDSNIRNGPLGVGWSLRVGSQISRTSRGQGVPHYDATDQLWLDGSGSKEDLKFLK